MKHSVVYPKRNKSMNFIQTLYIDTGKDPFHDKFGWVSPEYHLMGWAFSCLQLNKIYGNITLYANSPGAQLLIDTLQLPYTDVILAHDNLTLIHPALWALPKIYTYSLQERPFLHIDGDVFLFSPFDSNFLEGELIAQNVEMETENYYTPSKKGIMRHFVFFPSCVKKDFESGSPIKCCNAGVLGGHNILFFSEYASLAFEYINKNQNKLQNIKVDSFNVFFEQHLFYALAKEKNIPVNVLFKGIFDDRGYKYFGDFHDVPFNRNYLHLLGDFKRDEYTCIQMTDKLRELYPKYYERIVALFSKKNLQLSPCGFINGVSLSTGQLDEQSNTHLQRLKHIAEYCPENVDNEIFNDDFRLFYQKLISILKANKNQKNVCKRDIAARNWYCELFIEQMEILDKMIVRCRETNIIQSSFDWAGLFNKYYRTGVDYYEKLKIESGHFFNLLVPEATDNGFSLYDINEIDYALLQLLSEPLPIRDLIKKMEDYFDSDVIQNHYDVYLNLILSSIKQLVIQKAIQTL
ncbi:MAG: hypothetical protein LBE56_10180 [Tannerella sp.]|jgi:hypothetical protein|nr:hypothetical protein [Tannerella sp.]